jgi:hypothetical protein
LKGGINKQLIKVLEVEGVGCESKARYDELLYHVILVKVGCDVDGVTVSQLVRFLSKFYRDVKKDTLVRKVHRVLDRLEAEGLVFTEVVGRYRFVRLTLAGWRELGRAVDLKSKAS